MDPASYPVTTKQEAHSIIKDCLEANNSWVDTFNELGCILAFDLDPMLEGSVTVDFIIDDLWKKVSEPLKTKSLKAFAATPLRTTMYGLSKQFLTTLITLRKPLKT